MTHGPVSSGQLNLADIRRCCLRERFCARHGGRKTWVLKSSEMSAGDIPAHWNVGFEEMSAQIGETQSTRDRATADHLVRQVHLTGPQVKALSWRCPSLPGEQCFSATALLSLKMQLHETLRQKQIHTFSKRLGSIWGALMKTMNTNQSRRSEEEAFQEAQT